MQGSSIHRAEAASRAATGSQNVPGLDLRSKEVSEVGETGKVRVLFVHHEASHLRTFQEIVARQAVGLRLARDISEASQAIEGAQPPHVVFTDTKLPDGDWQDVLALALKASEAVNVVVVSAVGNISLYFEAVERGAFDLLTPNIAPRDFPLLLQAAAQDAVARRAAGASPSH